MSTNKAKVDYISDTGALTWREDFSLFPVASGMPPGFVNRWSHASWSVEIAAALAGGISDKELRVTSTADGRRFISFDAAGKSTDVEVLIAFYNNAPSSASSGSGGIIVRGGGVSGAEDGYWVLQSGSGGTANRLECGKYTAGGVTGLQNATLGFTWTADTWYYMRFRVIGTSIKARAWAVGSAEPGTWAVDTTDATHTYGRVGFFDFDDAGDCGFGYISVAYDGETAPFPDDASALRFSHAVADGIANRPAQPTVQVFAAPGTWTRPAGCRAIKVTVVGGGAGGGRGTAASPGTVAGGSGGGGGGVAEKFFPDVTPPSYVTQPVAVGTGGAAGAAPGTPAAGNGNPSTFGPAPGAVFTQMVGGGGTAGAAFPSAGGAGGPASGGDINMVGAQGGPSSGAPSTGAWASLRSGEGGGNKFASGGKAIGNPGSNAPAPGAAGQQGGGHGAGASAGLGGIAPAATNQAGAAGRDGIVIVEEFY